MFFFTWQDHIATSDILILGGGGSFSSFAATLQWNGSFTVGFGYFFPAVDSVDGSGTYEKLL